MLQVSQKEAFFFNFFFFLEILLSYAFAGISIFEYDVDVYRMGGTNVSLACIEPFYGKLIKIANASLNKLYRFLPAPILQLTISFSISLDEKQMQS